MSTVFIITANGYIIYYMKIYDDIYLVQFGFHPVAAVVKHVQT